MNTAPERLYYSISEVSEIAEVKPHVLRYWESQFRILKPKKNRAGNRMYRPRDLNLVLTIRDLLYRNGYTIAGARRKLLDARRQGLLENGCLTEPDVAPMPVKQEDEKSAPAIDERQLTLNEGARNDVLQQVREELRSLLHILDAR
jgi:DNA-binding transcriptional MerR regulator